MIKMKKIIVSLFVIVSCIFHGTVNIFAQDYIEYSDYISYEDIQTLLIQPIVEEDKILHHYYFDDYYYVTTDKSVIADFLNELFPLAVAEEENEKQLRYSIFISDTELSNWLDVTINSGIIYKKNNEPYFPELYIADAAAYEKICEKYIPMMKMEQMEKKTSIGYADPIPGNITIICSDWAIDYIGDAISKEVITRSDIFTETINREFFCELLYNVLNNLGYTNGINGVSSFEDINSENIDILVSMGIIRGKGESIFAPEDNITREEIATIINRSMEYINITPESTDFIYEDDADISEWAKDSVYKLAGSEIMEGDETHFDPQANCSKEQAVAALMRLYYKIADKN